MARITPAQNNLDLDNLRDYEPYRARITSIDWSNGSEEYGAEKRLEVTWTLLDASGADSGQTLKDWISLRLGQQQTGQVSKLRMLLNALAGQSEAAEVAWFDDETLEWSYGDDRVAGRLDEGMEVILRGKFGFKKDGKTKKFGITAYQPATTTAQPAPSGATANGKHAAPAAAAVGADDEIGF